MEDLNNIYIIYLNTIKNLFSFWKLNTNLFSSKIYIFLLRVFFII